MSLGLSSSSFSSKTTTEVLDILKNNSLEYIQWCDCHIPHGDENTARQVAELTKKAGIITAEYNSSFNLFESHDLAKDFAPVLKIADILGTDSICLRAGSVTYENADDSYIAEFIDKLETISDMAKAENKNISFEFLSNTLFDNYMTTLSLLVEFDFPNIFINWQPNAEVSLLYSLFELKTLIKYVKNVHITLKDRSGNYQPVIENKDDWRQYINILRTKSRYLLIDTAGTPEQLKNDAGTIRDILKLYDKN